MITAVSYSIKIPRRSSFDFVVEFQATVGVPMSLVGKTLLAQMWSRDRQEKYTDITVVVRDEVLGIVEFSLTAEQTTLLPTTGVYDVKAIGGGKEYYYLKGSFTTEEGYTDD